MSSFKKILSSSLCVGALMVAGAQSALSADLDPVVPAPVAEENYNFYVAVFGGASIITGDVDYENSFGTTVSADFDTGFTFGGALGYKWHEFNYGGITPRTEIEFNYTENNLDELDFSGNGVGNEVVIEGSQASAVGLRANLFLDATNIGGSRFTPYVGGGIGLNIINHNLLYNAPGLNLNDDGDVVFAWHVTGGVSYEVTKRASIFTDVGFHQAVNTSSERRIGGLSIAGANGGIFEDDINSVVVRAGLSVGF